MRSVKICMIGDFGVGKTSLVQRYVHSTFSNRYLTTVGVKTDTMQVGLASGDSLKMVLWDIAGNHTVGRVEKSYLRGAGAYLLVADGTRRNTLDTLQTLHSQARELLGEVPFACLVNKADLEAQWEVSPAELEKLSGLGRRPLRTSARTGDGVEAAFQQLAEAVAAG